MTQEETEFSLDNLELPEKEGVDYRSGGVA